MSLLPAPSRNNQTPTPGEHALLESIRALHDTVTTSHSFHNELLSILKMLSGEITNLSQRYSEAEGVPHGRHVTIFNAAAVQNTLYPSLPIDLNGSMRTLTIGGTGNISVYLNNPNSKSTLIATLPCNGATIDISTRAKIGIGYSVSIATDTVTNGVVALTSWIEPTALNAENQYRIRNY